MENNQPINNFDAMLKQSLQGSQMPVPAGVWEAVGSSIGTQAIVTTQLAGFKLLLIKAVAGIVLTSGGVYGVYQLLKTNDNNPITHNSKTNKPITNNSITPTEITLDTLFPTENIPSDKGVSTVLAINEDSMIANPKQEVVSVNNQNETTSEGIKADPKPAEIKKPVLKTETPKKQPESEKTKEPVQQNSESESVFSANDIIIPNIITPNEDGLNDCFKIIIENESVFILQIYDLENNKVFESTDKNDCWDGKNRFTGQSCPKGVYNYKFIFELKTGYHRKEHGQVTLL